MATYVYETIPRQPDEPPLRFEVVQSMKDAPLTRRPGTGEPVRRVISGGFGLMGLGDKRHGAPAGHPRRRRVRLRGHVQLRPARVRAV